MSELNIAVFISGSGTNLQSLIDKSESGELLAKIVAVISDIDDAYGLVRAERHNIPAFVVNYSRFIDSHRLKREAYEEAEKEIIKILEGFRIDYICLAGYMRLLTPYFLSHFRSEYVYRVLNIHPALLPSFPGRHGYEDTFNYGCKWGGITVHFVDEGEDTGPIIAQAVYPIWPDDTVDKIRHRGLSLEHMLYPQCINWLAKGFIRFERKGGRIVTYITDPDYRVVLDEMIKRVIVLK